MLIRAFVGAVLAGLSVAAVCPKSAAQSSIVAEVARRNAVAWFNAEDPGRRLVADHCEVVLVGVGAFAGRGSELTAAAPLRPLPGVAADVWSMYEFLTGSLGIADPGRVRVLLAAPTSKDDLTPVPPDPRWLMCQNARTGPGRMPTRDAVRDELIDAADSLLKRGVPGDRRLLVVYFAGHGFEQPGNRCTSLALADAAVSAAGGCDFSTLAPPSYFDEQLNFANGKGIDCLLILDACFSDKAYIHNGASEVLAKRAVLASAQGIADQEDLRGRYTKALVAASDSLLAGSPEGTVSFRQAHEAARASLSGAAFSFTPAAVWPAGMPEYVARLDAARLAAARDDAIRREAFRQGLVRRVGEWPEPRPLWCSHASAILARMSDRGRAAAEAEQDARDLAVYLAALDAPDDGQAQSAADGVYRASSLGRQQWELRRARLLPTERAMGIFGSQAFAEELQSLRASAADTGQLDAVAAIESEFRSAVRRRKIDNAVALMRLLTPNETRRVVISNAAKAMSELEELAPAPEEMKIGIKLLAEARATVLDRVRWLQAEERAIGLVDNARLPAAFDAARLERASQAAEAIRALVRSHGVEVVSSLPAGGLEELEAKIAAATQAAGEQRSKRDRLLAELAAGDTADAGPDARRRADAAADELQRLSDGGGLRLAPLDGAALARVFERTSGRGTFALRVTPTWRQDRLKTVWNPAALSESNRLFELCQLWISVALPQPGGPKIPVNVWVSVADKASPAVTTFGPYPIALAQQGQAIPVAIPLRQLVWLQPPSGGTLSGNVVSAARSGLTRVRVEVFFEDSSRRRLPLDGPPLAAELDIETTAYLEKTP